MCLHAALLTVSVVPCARWKAYAQISVPRGDRALMYDWRSWLWTNEFIRLPVKVCRVEHVAIAEGGDGKSR
jgi:hypothetical protein